MFSIPFVATVPTVYGIETLIHYTNSHYLRCKVATVPTVYGIETKNVKFSCFIQFLKSLQQYLPFTVLKRQLFLVYLQNRMLQQYLPFTVLKLADGMFNDVTTSKVATVPTVYGIETRRWNV